MSATEAPTTSSDASVGTVDLRLEVAIIPVSDVDRAKQFYEQVGFRIDADGSPLARPSHRPDHAAGLRTHGVLFQYPAEFAGEIERFLNHRRAD